MGVSTSAPVNTEAPVAHTAEVGTNTEITTTKCKCTTPALKYPEHGNISNKKRRRSTDDENIAYLILNKSHYVMQNGQSMTVFEGEEFPASCCSCLDFVKVHEISSLPHMTKHPNEYMCKNCADIYIKTDKKCTICREKDLLVKCHFCKCILPVEEVLYSFHDHQDEHCCYVCLSKMVRAIGPSQSCLILVCPSHTYNTFIELSSLKLSAEKMATVKSLASVNKRMVETKEQLYKTLPHTGRLFATQCMWQSDLD